MLDEKTRFLFFCAAAGWIALDQIMRWLSRSRRRQPAGTNTLRYPSSMLITGMIFAAYFLGLIVANVFFGNFRGTAANLHLAAIGTGLFCLFCITPIFFISYFFNHRRITPEELGYRSYPGSWHFMKWDQVQSLRWSRFTKSFVLHDTLGRKTSISGLMLGLPAFALAVLDHVPRSAIDPAAIPILERTAEGNLPSVWL